MRIPLPKHTLVTLTLVGALLTAVVTVGLMSPDLLPGNDNSATDTPGQNAALADDVPTPNENFTPEVQQAPAGEEHEEHEGYEDEEEEHEDEEYDDD